MRLPEWHDTCQSTANQIGALTSMTKRIHVLDLYQELLHFLPLATICHVTLYNCQTLACSCSTSFNASCCTTSHRDSPLSRESYLSLWTAQKRMCLTTYSFIWWHILCSLGWFSSQEWYKCWNWTRRGTCVSIFCVGCNYFPELTGFL